MEGDLEFILVSWGNGFKQGEPDHTSVEAHHFLCWMETTLKGKVVQDEGWGCGK